MSDSQNHYNSIKRVSIGSEHEKIANKGTSNFNTCLEGADTKVTSIE